MTSATGGLTVCVVFRDGRVRDLVLHGPLPPRLLLPDPVVMFHADGMTVGALSPVEAREFQLQIAYWEDDTIRDYFYVEV